MTEQIEVFLAEEPELFDTANKILNTHWVDWYIVSGKVEAKDAIVGGNARLVNLLQVIKDTAVGDYHYIVNQLNALSNDIEGYLKNFDVIANISMQGWLKEIKPEHPSIFATEGNGLDLRTWITMEANARGVNKYGYQHFIHTVAGCIANINLETYIVDEEPPILESLINNTPSMLWVLDYAARNKAELYDAHNEGVRLLKEQYDENPGPLVLEQDA